MTSSTWSESDTQRSLEIWDAYQESHDVSNRIGQTAGIDPAGGRVWIGQSAQDVYNEMRADGLDVPLYCVRVGYDYYVRKGGHR